MPKIYYIANVRMPTERAHGIQIAKMCEAFMDQGIDVELIVPRRKTSSESVRSFYGLRMQICVTTLPVIDWYTKGRFGFFVGSSSFMISYFFYLWYKKISRQPGILYTIDIDQFSFLLVPFLGAPYFAEIHDAKKRSIAFSILFRYARGIIAINRRIQETLIKEFRISPGRIVVYPNGVDVKKFDAPLSDVRSTLGLPTGKFIAMYVGKLYDWKHTEIIADAAQKAGDILFCIVGGTAEEFKKITGKDTLPKNLMCVGQKAYSEISLWMHAADVLILLGTKKSDYSYFHTSPMKLFEYMAAGKPIVAARTPANSEIVTEEEVIFYAPDNAKDFMEKIQYACAAPLDVLHQKTRQAGL